MIRFLVLLIALPTVANAAAKPVKKGAKKVEAKAREAEDPAIAEARAIYKRGETAFKLGRFDEALAEFSAAYEKKPAPAVLFNIAQCHFYLKHYERAVFFYEGYLRDNTNTAQATVARERLSEAKASLAEQQKIEAEQKRAEEKRIADAQAASMAAMRQIASAPAFADDRAPVVVESAPPKPGVHTKWWFWTIIGGVVLAGAAAGVAVGIVMTPAPQVSHTGTLGNASW